MRRYFVANVILLWSVDILLLLKFLKLQRFRKNASKDSGTIFCDNRLLLLLSLLLLQMVFYSVIDASNAFNQMNRSVIFLAFVGMVLL